MHLSVLLLHLLQLWLCKFKNISYEIYLAVNTPLFSLFLPFELLPSPLVSDPWKNSRVNFKILLHRLFIPFHTLNIFRKGFLKKIEMIIQQLNQILFIQRPFDEPLQNNLHILILGVHVLEFSDQ